MVCPHLLWAAVVKVKPRKRLARVHVAPEPFLWLRVDLLGRGLPAPFLVMLAAPVSGKALTRSRRANMRLMVTI